MYSIFLAILMGLLCPSHSNNHQGNGTTVHSTDNKGEQGTGGDTGDVRPPKHP